MDGGAGCMDARFDSTHDMVVESRRAGLDDGVWKLELTYNLASIFYVLNQLLYTMHHSPRFIFNEKANLHDPLLNNQN